MPSPFPSPGPRVAVSAFFAVTGFISASWITRIPAASSKLDLDTAQLGTLLLFLGIGSIVAFQFIGKIIERIGSAHAAFLFGCMYVLSLTLLALSPNSLILGASLFIYGFTFGAVDVAMNAQGVGVERMRKKPIMGSLHGFFSLGALVGSALSGVVAQAGVGLVPHFIAFSAIGLTCVLWANSGQIADETVPHHETSEKASRFSLPPRVLWPLGVIAFCGAVDEGGMADWSALFIHNELGGSEGVAAFGFMAFSTTMLIGRFAGDRSHCRKVRAGRGGAGGKRGCVCRDADRVDAGRGDDGGNRLRDHGSGTLGRDSRGLQCGGIDSWHPQRTRRGGRRDDRVCGFSGRASGTWIFGAALIAAIGTAGSRRVAGDQLLLRERPAAGQNDCRSGDSVVTFAGVGSFTKMRAQLSRFRLSFETATVARMRFAAGPG